MRVKVIGAGSIGNHLAQASRRAGWSVVMIDGDSAALRRTRDSIYPQRYGAWDDVIQLYTSADQPRGDFDVIFVGTPPDGRLLLATTLLEERPRLLHLEKPLCEPGMRGGQEFGLAMASHNDVFVTVGYDHAVSAGVEALAALIGGGELGEILTLDVEFREHWRGILAAHPWLSGPRDSYLGFSNRGGGSLGEHSHALHLWQYLARASGWGRVSNVGAFLDWRDDYEAQAALTLKTENSRLGRVMQDVVTHPPRKYARVQGERGAAEWICGGAPGGDLLRTTIGSTVRDTVFQKTRRDDFFREIQHYESVLQGRVNWEDSPLNVRYGLEVMAVIVAAHQSHASGAARAVNYDTWRSAPNAGDSQLS